MCEATAERVKDVLMRVLHVPSSMFATPARLDEIAAVDSLSLAELAAALEEEFAIDVNGEQLTAGLSLPQIVALVEDALGATAPR